MQETKHYKVFADDAGNLYRYQRGEFQALEDAPAYSGASVRPAHITGDGNILIRKDGALRAADTGEIPSPPDENTTQLFADIGGNYYSVYNGEWVSR